MSFNNTLNDANSPPSPPPTSATIASVAASTATSIASTLIATSISQSTPTISPTQQQQQQLKNEKSQNNSRLYPIICVICGLAFIAAVYFYIYATRNKNYGNDSHIIKNSNNQSSGGNSGRLDIHVDRLSKNSNSKGTAFNMLGNSGFRSEDTPTINNHSPYSDSNNLINNSGSMGYNYPNQKKIHYPNPLFEHSRPINRVPTVIRANESDITDEDVNINILTQEEVQLLKMKKRNMNNNNNNMNNHINMNNHMFNSNAVESNPMGMNNTFKTPTIDPEIHSKMPDMNVAPFNFMNPTEETTNPNELFRRESEESSFYDDTFIRNLGSDVKIETKKVEYIQPEDGPINKIKIKRLNN